MMKYTYRFWITFALAAALLAWWLHPVVHPIRIGVLHSLSGTMAENEQPLVEAAQLAVEEINAAGGLLNRPVEIVLADGRSDNAVFAAEAERLITQEKVSALFACWTSSCRKAVKPVVELHQHLLFYPLQYEGLEESANIFYTGATPNQQIIPGTRWTLNKLGKRVYLLGSDYIFPRTANLIIRDIIRASHGAVLAEHYLPLGERNFGPVIEELRKLKPDVVLNTITGDSNIHFFRALHEAGLGNLPVVSFSVAEDGLQGIGKEFFHPNHYAVWSYFQSMPGNTNQRFVQAFRAHYGNNRVTSAPIESAYVSVRLWAQAVRDAHSDEPQRVNTTMLQQSMNAPSGIAAIDRNTHNLWKQVYIGKARPDNQFDIIWNSMDTLRPDPFPDYRSESEWKELQGKLLGGGS